MKNESINAIQKHSEFNLQNVKCAGCVGKIENKLNQISGIYDARVNLLEKTLMVKYDNQKLDDEIISAVTSLGYGISFEDNIEDKTNLWISVGLPIIIGLFMMTFGMSEAFMPDYSTIKGFSYGLCESLLTLFIIVLTGKSMFKSGINGFRTLNFNMHSLVILGVSSAWLYSTWIVIINYLSHNIEMSHVYFESALIIIGLINLGAYLEDLAKTNTKSAIKSLIALQPDQTTIIKDGQEQIVNTNTLRTNDLIKIKPGERLPADGILLTGNGYLDESMLSGEPLAIHKKQGDKVIAGSINTNGVFTFEVNSVGSNTLLAGIINLVKTAQMSKPELAKLADKLASIFVPVIMLIALITAIVWLYFGPEPKLFYTISTFMAVLIIACPCSVGLAIPVALMVGLGKSATHGILIKDASCLNQLNQLDYILLDKTGTITLGKPEVVNFDISNDYSIIECLELIKSLEINSEHPLASAILNYKPEVIANREVQDFSILVGSGIRGNINNQTYFIGSKQWLKDTLYLESNLFINNHHTQVFLANKEKVLARIDISDAIKPDSIDAIKHLQKQGLKVAMVTGDNQNNAEYIAKQIGLDAVYANCKPEDKINIVKNLQQKHCVAFIGDGINDAPSLVQANVGIAIGSGTDIAMQSAPIILMNGSLHGISKAINIGKAINRNMKQNLFGSFIYNILAVSIAAGAFYPIWHILLNPVIASIAMSLSSITVILNALRLRQL